MLAAVNISVWLTDAYYGIILATSRKNLSPAIAPDKRSIQIFFPYFSTKTYVAGIHKKCFTV